MLKKRCASKIWILLILMRISTSAAHDYFPDDDKVILGRLALSGEFPFIVGILSKIEVNMTCGGIIMNAREILTSCHCLFSHNQTRDKWINFSAAIYTVVAGSRFIYHHEDSVQLRTIEKYRLHKHCKQLPKKRFLMDFAFVILNKPLKWSKWVQPAKFIETSPSKFRSSYINLVKSENVNCVGLGYGVIKSKYKGLPENMVLNKPSTVLKAMRHVLLQCEDCIRLACKKYECEDVFLEKNGCTYGRDKHSISAGDLSGALVCDGFVYGLYSWTPNCWGDSGLGMYSLIDQILLEYFKSAAVKIPCSFNVNTKTLVVVFYVRYLIY